MNIFKDKAIMNVVKFSVMLVIILVGINIVPDVAATYRDGNYLKKDVYPLETTNFDKYLEAVSSYYYFYYDKEPILEEQTVTFGDSSITLSGYAASYYQSDSIKDTMQFFLKDATYKGEEFRTIQVTLHYTDPIMTSKKDPNVHVYHFFTNKINNNDKVKSFWGADNKNNLTSKEENKLKAIKLSIKTKNHYLENFFAITDDEKIKNEFLISMSFKDNGLTKENYSISKNIKDKTTNIPTSEEVLENNLFYKEFDRSLLKPYNYIYVIVYVIFTIFSLSIFYLMFIHKSLVKALKDRKNQI